MGHGCGQGHSQGAGRIVECMTSSRVGVIEVLAGWPSSPEACRRVGSWAADPVLCRFAKPRDAAVAARGNGEVFAALSARRGDPLAATAALSAVAVVLVPVVRRWSRSGLAGDDLADAEADLIVEALSAMRLNASLDAERVAQTAWHRVSNRRRTVRARTAKLAELAPQLASGIAVQPAFEDPAACPGSGQLGLSGGPLGVVVDAVRAGMLSVTAAAVLWAAVAGYSTREAAQMAGCSPVAWRARRSRAFRDFRAVVRDSERR